MRLRAAREASGKTQTQVAKESNITVVAYQRYEYGKRKPCVDIAIRIAEVLGVTSFKQFKALFGAATPTTEKEPDGNPT